MSIEKTRKRIIEVAKAEVGYTETPVNITKYWKEMQPSFQGGAWCAAFVWWVILKATGFDIRPHMKQEYYVPSVREWAQSIGAWSEDEHEDGDPVVYHFGKPGHYAHIEESYRDENSPGYRAIGGNTSPNSKGSQSNGGGVYVRYRGRGSIAGWVRLNKVFEYYGYVSPLENNAPVNTSVTPSTKAPTKATGKLEEDGILGRATAQEIQQRLGVSVDGKIGPQTIRAWQKHEGTFVDGFISGQSSLAIKTCPAINSSCLKLGSNGSSLIKQLQRNIGVSVDGKIGPQTVKRLQNVLNNDKNALM